MRNLVLGTASAVAALCATPAFAQDTAPAAASPFSGPYVGLQIGHGQIEDLHTDRDDFWTNAKDGITRDRGVQVGIHAGYDMALGSAIVGVMGDVQFGKLDSFEEVSSGGSDVPEIYAVGTRLSRLASIRAKGGLISGPLAVYGTVGLAASNARQRFVETYGEDRAGSFSGKGDRTGVVYGFGADYALGNRFSLGLVYSHYDFGTKRHKLDAPYVNDRFDQRYKVRQLAVTAGYRFGAAGDAPKADAAAFAGPYVGVQLGRATVDSVSNDLDYYFYNTEIQTSDSAVVAGLRAGYDAAFGPVIVGALGEVSFGRIDSFADTTGDEDSYYYSAGTRLNRLGSLRAKLGLASGPLAGFVTGGLAWSNAKQRLENGWSDDYGYSGKGDRSGYVLGLGGAYAIAGKARLGVDFSQYEFGKRRHLLGGDTDYAMTDKYKVRTVALSFNYGF